MTEPATSVPWLPQFTITPVMGAPAAMEKLKRYCVVERAPSAADTELVKVTTGATLATAAWNVPPTAERPWLSVTEFTVTVNVPDVVYVCAQLTAPVAEIGQVALVPSPQFTATVQLI